MARNTYRDDPNFLFELHFTLYRKEYGPSRVTIRAWDSNRVDWRTGHNYIRTVMLWNGETVFQNNEIGIPAGTPVDGDKAKEHAVFWCTVLPSEEEQATPEQIEWVKAHGESLACEKEARFGEES